MLKAIKSSLAFMTPKERSKWYFLTGLRAMLSVLDLLGILAIGFVVTSTAIFLTQGSSPNRVLNFAGLQIPAVTAETLPIVGFSILAIFLIKALFSILISRTSALFVATIEARAAKAIAERVFGGDLAQARLRSREDMSYAIQFGSPSAFNHLLNFTSTVAAEGSLFVMICLGFLLVDLWATLGAVAYFAIIALVIQYFVGTLMARAGVKAVKGTIEANGAVGDLISVFRELSVLKLRHKYIDRIYQSRISAAESAATQTYLNNMPRYIVEAALLIGVALFILVQALTGEIVSSAATIGVFLSGGFRLTAALLPLQNALLGIKAQVPVASRAHAILLESQLNSFQENNLADPGRTAGLALGPIGVEFQDVSFQYENSSTFAIKNVAFTIKAGQQVAFLGPSGAGKSTIADLMCGVARPAIGQVLLDIGGEDIPNNHSYSVSYVPQKPGIVSGSVSQNVALGSDPENINEREVFEAITRANLEPVISSLPLGIHTDLGNFHDALSGGQIQRLGLARALYSKPGLLVMDEATSALDAESEAEIAKALEKMRGKVTVVLIAHRLNTVQHADQVFLIEEGRIVDQGTFQELIRRNPSIVRLVQLMKVDED
jgi:ABC-type bacteriocin/lantibiotic exporter with double-glycine peptidase domain